MNDIATWFSLHQQTLYIVILMIFVGIEIIGRVPSVLHTPLMSGANAIHGVVIIGAIIIMGRAETDNYLALILGFLAVVLGTLNVVGGFVVTDRMLEMLKSKNKESCSMEILISTYLIASVTFIIGLKMLTHPGSARKGNLIAAAGMGLAIIGTIFFYQDPASGERLHNYGWIFGGLAIGGVIGTMAARRVKMTAMPEMVSLFNGMGGACAALISIVEFHHFASSDFTFEIFEAFQSDAGMDAGYFELPIPTGTLITIFLGLIIGSVSFAGSM